MVFHKAGLEAGVSPKDELKWGARDLTGPWLATPCLEESEPRVEDAFKSHLDFLFGVVEGVREEKVEEELITGV